MWRLPTENKSLPQRLNHKRVNKGRPASVQMWRVLNCARLYTPGVPMLRWALTASSSMTPVASSWDAKASLTLKVLDLQGPTVAGSPRGGSQGKRRSAATLSAKTSRQLVGVLEALPRVLGGLPRSTPSPTSPFPNMDELIHPLEMVVKYLPVIELFL